MDITLDEVYFILSPTMRLNSKDDSYLQENDDELVEPYDSNNCFDIFQNNLKLRKKKSELDENLKDQIKKITEGNDGDELEMAKEL